MAVFLSSRQCVNSYFRPQQTVRLKNVVGNPIQALSWFSIDYARSVNSVGGMTLVLPKSIPYQMLTVDNRIEVYRTIDGSSTTLDMDTSWLIKSIRQVYEESGKQYWEVTCEDFKTIIKSRIVAYNKGTAQARKATYSDNLLKAVMRENIGSSAISGRNISSYLSIQADSSLGAVIYKEMEYRNLDEIFGEVIEASLATSKPVYFDIVMTGSTNATPEFRTYMYQRGDDHRAGKTGAIILSPGNGNVGPFSVTDSYIDEATYVYAIGPGNLGAIMIQAASDATKIGRSPWGRIEKTVNVNSTEANMLTEEANAELQLSRSRKVVEGSILQTSRYQYGRDWKFGDRMTFNPQPNNSFDVRVDAVHVSVSQQQESVESYFRN
jgi:hypothetical protein